MSLPTLSGTGRLTADPELRFAATGTAVAKVNLAFNSRRKNAQTGEWEDSDVLFVSGTLFNAVAENVAESLKKGDEVVVSGRLKIRSFETKEGEKRSVTELMVDSIGPSLRFATAKVSKMSRGSTGQASTSGDDPWASAAPAQQQAGSGFDNEPPF